MGKPELQGREAVCAPPPFLGNLSRQALNLRQETGSGYQEVRGIPWALVKGACGGGALRGDEGRKEG